MMVLMKKNILSKLLILFSIVGIIPLVAIAIYSYNKSREALFINVRYDIEGDAKDIASSISHLFNKARSDILLLTVNPAFKRYFLEPEKKSFWLKELEKAFLYLSKIFPDSFDEGCYIISDGREICRVIFDKLAHPTELSIDETRNAFFAPTFTYLRERFIRGLHTSPQIPIDGLFQIPRPLSFRTVERLQLPIWS